MILTQALSLKIEKHAPYQHFNIKCLLLLLLLLTALTIKSIMYWPMYYGPTTLPNHTSGDVASVESMSADNPLPDRTWVNNTTHQ